MRYMHTMVRISDVQKALDFYCGVLGLQVTRRIDRDDTRLTALFVAAPVDVPSAHATKSPELELIHYWDADKLPSGHVAFAVDDLYDACQVLLEPLPVQEPWKSMQTVGAW